MFIMSYAFTLTLYFVVIVCLCSAVLGLQVKEPDGTKRHHSYLNKQSFVGNSGSGFIFHKQLCICVNNVS